MHSQNKRIGPKFQNKNAIEISVRNKTEKTNVGLERVRSEKIKKKLTQCHLSHHIKF